MGLLFDDDFGLGSGSMNKMAGNPLVLAGLQMLANGSPQINKIPNTLENVPNVLMTASTTQRKFQDAENERKRQLQEDADKQTAWQQAFQTTGMSPADAGIYKKNPAAASFFLDQTERQKQNAQADRFFNNNAIDTSGVNKQAPQQQPAAQPPAAAPDPQAQARQQAISDTASKFDNFGLSSVGKTVGTYAASLGDPQKAAAFMQAAQAQGLTPDSPITGPLLSDPAKGGALARSIGIGADMPDDAFAASHAQALQGSRERQATRAAAQQQFQQNTQGVAPAAPVVAPQQAAPQQAAPQVPAPQVPAPQQQAAPAQQQPAPQQQAAPAQQQPAPQNTTEKAVALREQNRVAELRKQIEYNARFLNNPKTKAAAEHNIRMAEEELKQKPSFTTIGKDSMGREIKGFVHPDGTVTPYNPPKQQQDEAEAETLPGDTVDERLKSVPAGDRATVKAMIEGRQAPPAGQALRSERVQYLLNMANRVDPDFDQTKWHERATEAKAMASSGKTGQSLTSINTLINHLGHLDRSIDKLDNTSYEWLNKGLQAAKSVSGDKEFQKARADFESYRKSVADELVKLLRGGIGAASDVADWNEKLSKAKSPAELHQVVDSMTNVMMGRAKPLVDTHNKAFGKNTPVEEYLSPEAQDTLKEIQDRRVAQPEDAPAKPRRTGRYPGNSSSGALPPGVKSIQVVE